MAMDKSELVNVFDYEAAAREILPKLAYDYYRSGANDFPLYSGITFLFGDLLNDHKIGVFRVGGFEKYTV